MAVRWRRQLHQHGVGLDGITGETPSSVMVWQLGRVVLPITAASILCISVGLSSKAPFLLLAQ